MSESRAEREQEFHDRAFTEGTRRAVDKYYAVGKRSVEAYENSLHAGGVGRVLEYGCGPGSHAFYLAERGAHVTGIDISPAAIGLAEAEAERLGVVARTRFVVGDAEQLPFEAGAFDLVCGESIVHHLEVGRAFSEVARVLAPAGRAVFREPLGHNPAINLFRRRTPDLRTADERPLRLADIRLAERWFASVETRYFHLTTLAAVPLRRTRAFEPVRRTLDAVDSAIFRAVPPSRRWAWQVVLTLTHPTPCD